MDGERWRTSTKQLQETLKVCEAVRRMPGELGNSGVATLHFVRNVEHTTHNALHTTHYTRFYNVNASFGECAGKCIEAQTNMPTREDTCYGG